MRRVQAKNHKRETHEINKIFLSWFDGERFVLNDGIHTRAYFHKVLKNKFLQIKDLKKILTNLKHSKDFHEWSK